jgi:glycosyltransferase-like protein LARGE
MVERQCTAWPERLAVAVHAPFAAGYGLISMSNATIRRWPEQKVLELVAALHNRTEADPAACALELRVVREDFAAATLTRASSYPVNAVRNRALQLVRTDALVLLDADFLPSATLGALAVDYRRGGAAGREIARYLDEDVVYVLPAFQATTTAFDDAGVRGAAAAAEDGKATIVAALANGSLVGFAANHFPAGHGATNFTRWVNASSQYEVDYQHGFEPYILASRRHVPWYDERFFGYGYNKIEHLTHMWSLGVRWVVHPSAYVVHQPHADSASKELWLLEGNKQTMKNFFKGEVLPEMLGDQFVPVATLPAACSTLDLELGLLEPPATLNVPTVRVRTAIVNWAPFHQEVMAALAYHFQRLGHDVSVFQLRDASQPSTAVEQAMRGFYQREIYESKNFYDSAGAYNIVVFTTPGHCEQAGEECLANAIRISHPASVFLVVHHAREVRALLSHVRREAARGVRLLTLGPHINAAVNQAIERDGDRDLGAAQWIAPVFPVVLPEDCRGDDDGGDDGSGGDNGDIVGDAVPLPVGLDHRGACNRSAVWQSVAKPSAKKQRLSFCLQARTGQARGHCVLCWCPPPPCCPPCRRVFPSQGNLDNHRRNYSGLFGDITARSAALSAAGVSLVLQGSPGTMEMPTTLIKQHLVRVYQNLTFQARNDGWRTAATSLRCAPSSRRGRLWTAPSLPDTEIRRFAGVLRAAAQLPRGPDLVCGRQVLCGHGVLLGGCLPHWQHPARGLEPSAAGVQLPERRRRLLRGRPHVGRRCNGHAGRAPRRAAWRPRGGDLAAQGEALSAERGGAAEDDGAAAGRSVDLSGEVLLQSSGAVDCFPNSKVLLFRYLYL